jgi:hypothetical protein
LGREIQVKSFSKIPASIKFHGKEEEQGGSFLPNFPILFKLAQKTNILTLDFFPIILFLTIHKKDGSSRSRH